MHSAKWRAHVSAVIASMIAPLLMATNPAEIYKNGLEYHEAGQFEQSVACFCQILQIGRSKSLIELHALRTMHWDQAAQTIEPYWWYDADIRSKKIVVKHDGGVGDAVQFLRYVKHLHAAGAYTMVETPPVLAALYARCPYIDCCVPYGTTPAADISYTISTPRLAFTMRSTLHEPSADVPYIGADPQLVEQWRATIAALPRPRIGICWCSSPLVHSQTKEKFFSPRSIPLELFASLFKLPGSFISLQCGFGSEQAASCGFPLISFPDLDMHHGRFMDTIAIMDNLDLVITVDTSIAHVAGGRGRPVWTLLPACSDFRWFTERNDSPWYPTMRLFRQQPGMPWDSVIDELLIALQQRFVITLPFDDAMQRAQWQWIIDRENTALEVGVNGQWLYDFFKAQWEQHQFSALSMNDCATLRIPKILHQIWIGDGVPEALQPFQHAWALTHPNWEYHLWTQYNIASLPLINRSYIDAAQNPAEKADLLRLELLNIFGGVYVDMDCEPFISFDMLNYSYDFFVGIHPLDTGLVQLGSAVIGAIPGHPIIKAAIDTIPANYANPALKNSITCKTGPVHLTRQFILHANRYGLRDCALPAPYFYPLGATQQGYAPMLWKKNGAFSVHHWAKTWNKPQCRRPQFRDIKSWGVLL